MLLTKRMKNKKPLMRPPRSQSKVHVLGKIDPNKSNPDVPSKYQEDKSLRKNMIQPANFKVDNIKIAFEEKPINDLLKKELLKRNEKVEIPKHKVKRRILNKHIEDYSEQKDVVVTNKEIQEKKIEEGRKTTQSILDQYS